MQWCVSSLFLWAKLYIFLFCSLIMCITVLHLRKSSLVTMVFLQKKCKLIYRSFTESDPHLSCDETVSSRTIHTSVPTFPFNSLTISCEFTAVCMNSSISPPYITQSVSPTRLKVCIIKGQPCDDQTKLPDVFTLTIHCTLADTNAA